MVFSIFLSWFLFFSFIYITDYLIFFLPRSIIFESSPIFASSLTTTRWDLNSSYLIVCACCFFIIHIIINHLRNIHFLIFLKFNPYSVLNIYLHFPFITCLVFISMLPLFSFMSIINQFKFNNQLLMFFILNLTNISFEIKFANDN